MLASQQGPTSEMEFNIVWVKLLVQGSVNGNIHEVTSKHIIESPGLNQERRTGETKRADAN